jgi:hypothetical protein
MITPANHLQITRAAASAPRCLNLVLPPSPGPCRVDSLQHVRATGLRLLAGLAAPDANSHALHSELQ